MREGVLVIIACGLDQGDKEECIWSQLLKDGMVLSSRKNLNRWFSRYVIAVMLVDENKRFLISSFCSSTSNCTLQHYYLCP